MSYDVNNRNIYSHLRDSGDRHSTLRRLSGRAHRAILLSLKQEDTNMNNYVTGATIKRLREKQNLTQAQLAKKLTVSDKTVSK